MHKIHELKEKFLKELKEYADRSSFSPADVETVRNLISAINKLCEYTESEEEKEYSGRMSHRGSYDYYDGHDSAYARGRSARRDALGRYSREDGYSRNDNFINKLYEVMDEAPEHKKHEIQQLIDKMQ